MCCSAGRMWKQLVCIVMNTWSEKQHNLATSLQPIICVMQVFGTSLNVTVLRSPLKSFAIVVYGAMVFVFMVASNCIYITSFSTQSLFRSNSTRERLDVMEKYQSALWNWLLPLSMFYATSFKWAKVWKKAEKMETLMSYQTRLYQRLHKASIISIALVVTAVNIFFLFEQITNELTFLSAGNCFEAEISIERL